MKSGILLPVLLLSFLSSTAIAGRVNVSPDAGIADSAQYNVDNPRWQEQQRQLRLMEAANSIKNGYNLTHNLGVSNQDFRDMCMAAQTAALNNVSKETVYLSVARGQGDIQPQYKRIIGHAAEGCWQYMKDGGKVRDVIPEAFQ
ncbi:TPA: hypothetical protein HLU32_16635 [Escherichia coli]|nr:hypothetical protein [Escherichia coli]HAJ4256140.1 hypothetical protein [Escherichia coli]HAJ4382441.1 hypothetical protein [Escherichia coli]